MRTPSPIVISHCSEDNQWTWAFVRCLEESGFETSHREFSDFSPREVDYSAFKTNPIFVAILSPQFLLSETYRREVLAAALMFDRQASLQRGEYDGQMVLLVVAETCALPAEWVRASGTYTIVSGPDYQALAPDEAANQVISKLTTERSQSENRAKEAMERAHAFLQMGQEHRAVDAAKLAVTLMPHSHYYWSSMAWVLSESNRIDEAAAAYDEATRLSPYKREPLYSKGLMLSYNGLLLYLDYRIAQARDAFFAALRFERVHTLLEPSDSKLWIEIGKCNLILNKYREACTAFERALISGPEDVAGVNGLEDSERAQALRGLQRAHAEMNIDR